MFILAKQGIVYVLTRLYYCFGSSFIPTSCVIPYFCVQVKTLQKETGVKIKVLPVNESSENNEAVILIEESFATGQVSNAVIQIITWELQSSQVKYIPHDSVNEFIIYKLSP